MSCFVIGSDKEAKIIIHITMHEICKIYNSFRSLFWKNFLRHISIVFLNISNATII